MSRSVEHFIPKVYGGSKGPDNCVVAHIACNSDRGARIPTAGEMRRFLELKGKPGRAVIGNAFSKFAKFVREAREALG